MGLLWDVAEASCTGEVKDVSEGTTVSLEVELLDEIVDPGVNTVWEVSCVEIGVLGEVAGASIRAVEGGVSGGTAVSVENVLVG